MNLKPYPVEGGGFIVTDPAILPTCTLKKMQTDDGTFRYVEGKTYVGKPYKFSPASRRVEKILHKPTGITRPVEIVMVYDERGFFGMMPTECLELPNLPPNGVN